MSSIYGNISNRWKRYMKTYSGSIFNWIFGISWIFLTLLSIITSLSINFSTNLEWDFTQTGIKVFFEIFDGPIKFLTASIASVVLLFTARRMEQTEKQINIMSASNQFNNYYTHRKEFIEFRDKETKFFPLVKSIINRKTTGKLQGNFDIKQESIDELQEYFNVTLPANFLQLHAFFFGAFPSEFKLPFSNSGQSLIDSLTSVSKHFANLKASHLDEIEISSIRIENSGSLLYIMANNIELAERILFQFHRNEKYRQTFGPINRCYWQLCIIREITSFSNYTLPGSIQYFLAIVEREKNEYLYI